MTKLFTVLAGGLLLTTSAFAQKGLIISEFLANPNGSDSPYEYIELVATTSINFATTPYTVVVTDAGAATSNGWKAGGTVTYAFQISAGSVTAGQVVYVGGSSMLPLSNSGTSLRSINTGTTAGDNFGTASSDGVLGNGGSNADGIAVFDVAASSINSSKVPVDAIFFGDAIGTAFKSSGSGYQLPVNDMYNGGKLQTNSFEAPDPGADQLIKATTGTYNPTTGTFTTARTWALTTAPSYNQTSLTIAGNTVNQPPVVTLAIPTVSGNAPATVALSAAATDADGTVSNVAFYNGTTLLTTVTTAPYTYSWTNVAAGTYTITAKATDNAGAVTTATTQTVTVNPASSNVAPTVTLAIPTVSGTAPATVSLSATAADADGTVSSVKFYNGSTLLTTITVAPYTYSWTSVAAGTYTITAKATDNGGAVTTSAIQMVTVNAPAANVAPTIAFIAGATYLVNETSGQITCTIGDTHDPVIVSGLDINVTDESLSTLTFSMTSSKTSVVPNANFSVTGTGNARKFKITPTGVGVATITLKVTDNGGLNKSISFALAVSDAYTTNANVTNYYNTGFADASAAIAIDSNFMFVADDETNLIGLYNRKASGLPVYEFDPSTYLGLTDDGEVDIEAAFVSPTNPHRIYWFGSQGNSKKGNVKVDRDRVFATDVVGAGANATLTFVGYYKGLRSKIIAWGDANGLDLSDAAADGEIPKEINGYNIEGAVMAPNGTTAYIGFRAPYVPPATLNKALICPIQNFESWFNAGAPSASPAFGAPIEISLGTRGIRDIEKNASNQYLIVAGSYDATSNFALYSWNGVATSAPVNLNVDLTGLSPEAIPEVPASLSTSTQIQLVSDNGSDEIYNDGVENKDNTVPNYKKFVTSYLTIPSVTQMAYVHLGADATNGLSKVTLAPNPTSGTVMITFSENIQAATIQCEVYNSIGVMVKKVSVPVAGNQSMIDLGSLAAGAYFIHINDAAQTLKVMKD
jgi:hypothetical protein